MTDQLDRASIIESMCLTWRHDFGLDRLGESPVMGAGMTDEERDFLRREMGQLFDNHIVPAVQQAIEAERASCVAIVESHGKDHAKVRFIANDIRSRAVPDASVAKPAI